MPETGFSSDSIALLVGVFGLVVCFLTSFYFNKDIFYGRSIAKRILGLQIVDNVTGQVATPFQCLLRNITIAIWPVEVIITLFNPTRRLGDRIARTKTIFYRRDQLKTKMDWNNFILAIFSGLLLLLICCILMFLFKLLMHF